jgi:protein arginine kinase
LKIDLTQICRNVGSWLTQSGPVSDIVISSRVRLARNIAGFHFYSQADSRQREEILQFAHDKLMSTNLHSKLLYINMCDTSDLERQLLTERHLISKELAEKDGARALAWTHDESLAVMINEEDHLRIQVMANGLQLDKTFARICEVDDLLARQLEYAFSSQYGYLTACPTNVGTGIRVSVMLHLPGLKMTQEIEKVFRAAKDMHLAVRGLYGEGSEPIGDFFQLSNQITLGKTEEEIIKSLVVHAVEPIVEYEKRARHKLMQEKKDALDDKIFRAKGILSTARLISSEEALYMLSFVRLGIHLGRIRDIDLATVNRLFLLTQPAHLQNLYQETFDAPHRDIARAEYIRKALCN